MRRTSISSPSTFSITTAFGSGPTEPR
jgi:hypothetical protein